MTEYETRIRSLIRTCPPGWSREQFLEDTILLAEVTRASGCRHTIKLVKNFKIWDPDTGETLDEWGGVP